MLLLLWRFPMPTSIASIVSLGFLLHCVHFARWVDLAAACRTETSEFAGPPLPAAGGGISGFDGIGGCSGNFHALSVSLNCHDTVSP
jgi:hypothetical protein